MTANVMQSDRDRCTAVGMNDFVAKPIEPDALFRTLLKWVAARAPDAAQVGAGGTAAPAADAFPEHIEGIDLTVGLRRMMGKRARYLSILRMFCEGHGESDLALSRAIDDGDIEVVQRLAHTLKGLAGQIGANGLQHEAEVLEHAAREGATGTELRDRLQRFSLHLTNQIDAIRRALPSREEPVPSVDPEQSKQLLAQLDAFLANDDAKAERLLTDNAASFEASLPGCFRELRQAVREFDFERALELLREAHPPGAGT